jgi:glutaconate CoA-transferase subunit B
VSSDHDVGVLADALCATLAEEIAASDIRVYAVTSPLTVVAALAARRLGRPDLAIAGGFTCLDAHPTPSLTLGEAGLVGPEPVVRDGIGDVFALLARGTGGVTVMPAQLDARGRTNLSGVGPPGRPKVALPGSRGLPDNNDSPARVWFLLVQHSPRTLVGEVDVVSGPAPSLTSPRRLITPAGLFDLRRDGWRAMWLTPGGAEMVAQAPDLGARIPDGVRIRRAPRPRTLAALRAVDPHGVRAVEVAGREEAARLWAVHARREAGL